LGFVVYAFDWIGMRWTRFWILFLVFKILWHIFLLIFVCS